jgi:hypothetical protein
VITFAGTSSEGCGFLALILAAGPGVERFFQTLETFISLG